MSDFLRRNKAFILVTLATIILLVGGIFLMTRGNSSLSTDSSLLFPQNATATSGFSNGNYLPYDSTTKVTLVEFGDYECPACSVYSPFIKQLLTEFSGKITFVFRNYPLPQHKNAPISSYAVEAAGLQGKYWQMHDKIYETQNDWASSANAQEIFVGFAKDMGLDTNKFVADLASDNIKNIVQKDTKDGNSVKLTETPTFYLNGKKIIFTGKYDQLKKLVESELSK